MGYYTNFSIDIKTAITRAEAKDITEAINRAICPLIKSEDDWLFSLDDYSGIEDDEKATWELIPDDIMKWYDWEKDMKEIAKKYPVIEFRVEGSGEDKDDWWVALFKGDRFQIKYAEPPIDEWEAY